MLLNCVHHDIRVVLRVHVAIINILGERDCVGCYIVQLFIMDSDSSPTKKGSKKGRGRGTSTSASTRGRPRGRGRGKRAVKVLILHFSCSNRNSYSLLQTQVIMSDDEESEGEEQTSFNKSTDVENEKPSSPELIIKHAECKFQNIHVD